MSKKYVADFETSTLKWYRKDGFARIWSWGILEIGGDNFYYGNTIESFFERIQKRENYNIYIHNLKYYGEYLISYLMNNGFKYINDKEERSDKTFIALISASGEIYKIEVYFSTKGRVNKAVFYDSLKIVPESREVIAEDFKLEDKLYNIDLSTYREVNHELTEDEIAHIKGNLNVMSNVLNDMFSEGLNKMTLGSDAINFYKDLNKSFDKYFPKLNYEIAEDIRSSYKGGFNYLSEEFKEKTIEDEIITFDINGLYSHVMRDEFLPFGDAVVFEGEYKENKLYPLYIQRLVCVFKLKENHLPTLILKDDPRFRYDEFVKDSNGEFIELLLTSVDLKLFFENYDVYFTVYQGGYMFKKVKGMFNEYIDFWISEKEDAKKEKNISKYIISKKMLNALYGKFGTNPNIRNKYPELDETNGIIYYIMQEKKETAGVYMPIASFITSYARRKIIKICEAIIERTKKVFGENRFIYSDTDSCHIKINRDEIDLIKDIIELEDLELGKFKIECIAKRSIYIKQKCYLKEVYENDGTLVLKSTISGLPKELSKYINFDNFKKGLTIEANDEELIKLDYLRVKGGVVIKSTTFTIQ